MTVSGQGLEGWRVGDRVTLYPAAGEDGRILGYVVTPRHDGRVSAFLPPKVIDEDGNAVCPVTVTVTLPSVPPTPPPIPPARDGHEPNCWWGECWCNPSDPRLPDTDEDEL